MSLIAVAQQVRGPRTLTRTLLVVMAVTVAIITGLLAMHSLNTHATGSGHGDTVAVDTNVTASASGHHDAPTRTVPAGAPAETASCVDCGNDHAMAWTACVLALLITVILFARSGAGWRTTALGRGLPAVLTWWQARARALPPPRSLTVLCISRT